MPVGDSEGRTPGGDSRPTPDPTSLTTEQLDKGLAALKEVITSKVEGLGAVVDEKFEKVDSQFTLVEQMRVEQKTDTKAAVDAALIAQKEAVKEQTVASERSIAKSEAATAKQLEQLATTFTTEIRGVLTGMSDLKERVGRIENLRTGGKEMYALLAGLVVLALAVVGGIAAFQK